MDNESHKKTWNNFTKSHFSSFNFSINGNISIINENWIN